MADHSSAHEWDLVAVCPHDTSRWSGHWERLIEYLRQRTGFIWRFRTYPTFREFRADLEVGRFLWAYLNPADFLFGRERVGYRGIAQPSGRRDIALVIRRGPPVSLADLAGRRLATARGYLCAIVRQRLLAAGVGAIAVEAKSYNEVMTLIENGEADFGITYNEHFVQLAPSIRAAYSVVLEVDCELTHVVAVHPEISNERAERLTTAVIGAHEDASGRPLLAAVGLPAFEPFDAKPFLHLEDLFAEG